MLPISVGMNYSDLTTWRHLKDGNKRYHSSPNGQTVRLFSGEWITIIRIERVFVDFLGAARVSVCVCVCTVLFPCTHVYSTYMTMCTCIFFCPSGSGFLGVSGLKMESTQDGYCLLTEYMNFPILGSSYRGYPLVICYIAIEYGPFIVDYLLKIVIFHSYVSLPEGTSHGFIRRSCSYTVYDTPWYPRKWLCLIFCVPKPMVHREYSPLLKVIWGPFLHGQTHPDRSSTGSD